MAPKYSRIELFILSLLALIIATKTYAEAEEVIIVNPSVKVNQLSQNALRAIFGMRLRTWPDSQVPIRVFVYPDDNLIHVGFAKKKLSIFPHQLRRAWDRLVYSGTGQAPTPVSSESEMISMVASTPGAIGYVEKDKVNNSVRVVEVR